MSTYYLIRKKGRVAIWNSELMDHTPNSISYLPPGSDVDYHPLFVPDLDGTMNSWYYDDSNLSILKRIPV